MTFIRFWVGMTAFGLSSAVALLIWAFRARQFREPDRAAYMPLAGVPGPPAKIRAGAETKALLAVLLLCLGTVAAGVVVSLL